MLTLSNSNSIEHNYNILRHRIKVNDIRSNTCFTYLIDLGQILKIISKYKIYFQKKIVKHHTDMFLAVLLWYLSMYAIIKCDGLYKHKIDNLNHYKIRFLFSTKWKLIRNDKFRYQQFR